MARRFRREVRLSRLRMTSTRWSVQVEKRTPLSRKHWPKSMLSGPPRTVPFCAPSSHPSPSKRSPLLSGFGLQRVRGRFSRASGQEMADKLQKMLISFGLENAEIAPNVEAEVDTENETLADELREHSGAGVE